MTRARSAVKTTRKRHSEEFKAEVLALADTVGVSAAATQLGLHSSQIYGWRSKAQLLKNRGQIDEEQARELVRLKRQLAEQAEELALLKKAAAYFAKSLK
jgi:transposase